MLTPEVNKVYLIKHSSGFVNARFLRLAIYNPTFNPNWYYERRSTTHYVFENLKTGREIVLKSRVKIRRDFLLDLSGEL